MASSFSSTIMLHDIVELRYNTIGQLFAARKSNGFNFRHLVKTLVQEYSFKLISTHCLSLASLSFLLSLTTTSVYAIAKTLKLHTKCSLWACCCIIMSIVLWSFKLWVKMFDHSFVEEYMTCWLGKNQNYIQNALPLQVVALLIIIVPYSPSIGKCFVFYLYPHLSIKSIV